MFVKKLMFKIMPTVSIVIPTYNRPEFLKKAIFSILNQTYQDFEIIVIDDGLAKRADKVIKKLNDPRIKYIQHETSKGGSAARNTGIKNAQGKYIAFLDDDDEWLKDKLQIQLAKLQKTTAEVGFCFSAVIRKIDKGEVRNKVTEGLVDYYEIALRHFKGVLTSTLLVKKEVFEICGLFDESLPSHQDAELIIRLAKKYQAIGINKPLVKMFGESDHAHIGGDLDKRARGLEMLLVKHKKEYATRPKVLARNLFRLAIFYRDNNNKDKASQNFKQAWLTHFKWRYFLHYLKSFII